MKARIAAVAAVLLLVAGCVRIPTEGEVSTVAIEAEGGNDELLVLPEGPVAGASPQEILRGFIQAGRGPQDGYAVAFEYLTDEFAARWSPVAGVIVTPTPIVPDDAGEDSLRLSLAVSAELDSHGRYTAAPVPSERELVYRLALEDGQWRIDDGPDGTVLTPASFDAIFEPAELRYFSPDFRFLVPQQRWFLDTRTVANRVVEELLLADAPLVDAGVLRTAFPSGTELRGTVDLNGAQANVTLSSEVLAADSLTQSRMLAQLDASLRSLGDVQSTTIIAGGFPLAISPAAGIDSLRVDPMPIAVADDEFGVLGPEGVTRLPEFGSVLDGIGARAVCVGRERDTAAVLTADGVHLVTGGEIQLIDDRQGLAAPSLDPWGWVWSTPRDSPSGLQARDSAGAQVSLPLDAEGRVTALRLSRDGTRLLVVLTADRRSRAIVWGVQRDEAFAPVALVEPVVLADGDELRDAAWVDGGAVALLGGGAPAPPITLVRLDGRASPLGAVADAVQLVGGNGSDGIRVLDADGSVWRPGGDGGWLETGWRASFLGVQQ